MRAIAFVRWAARFGVRLSQAAERLGLAPRTLQRWVQARDRRRLRARDRGRPTHRSDRELRNRFLALIGLLGPSVGVPTLMEQCPGLARREAEDLLRRYRRAYRRRRQRRMRTLSWSRAGAVWAIDFAEPPQAIDGRYPRLLAVRDLASGMQLCWLPSVDESAQSAMDALKASFMEHGRPLVLKTDNGSAFIAAELAALLAERGIWHLFSPPRLPSYNGSCEAGIGSMKTRTHHRAASRGHPDQWSCDDVEAARLEANETARPWGNDGPTPEQMWQGRQSITTEERTAFNILVQDHESRARQEQGYAADIQLDRIAQAAVNRVALQRALVAAGILQFTTGRPDTI
jgi:transposase InsO family protein